MVVSRVAPRMGLTVTMSERVLETAEPTDLLLKFANEVTVSIDEHTYL